MLALFKVQMITSLGRLFLDGDGLTSKSRNSFHLPPRCLAPYYGALALPAHWPPAGYKPPSAASANIWPTPLPFSLPAKATA